jgi:hypothetical protein
MYGAFTRRARVNLPYLATVATIGKLPETT